MSVKIEKLTTPITAAWLRREGAEAVVLVELDGRWIELIREQLEGPFSHIVESRGIMRRAGVDPA